MLVNQSEIPLISGAYFMQLRRGIKSSSAIVHFACRPELSDSLERSRALYSRQLTGGGNRESESSQKVARLLTNQESCLYQAQ